jgi:pimeloyl-ACP methyl ester carboxylesterase
MMSNVRALMSPDEAEYESGARAFLRGCTALPLAPAVFDRALGAMLRVPAHVRRALLARSEDYLPELTRCTAPVATLHGSLDVLEGVGHIAWLESPDAFVSSVRALCSRCE